MRLKRHYAIVAHSPDVVELRYGAWNPVSFTLTDESGSGHLLNVLRRLDGTLTGPEIAAAEGIPTAEVEALFEQLAELEVIEEQSSHALDYHLDFVVPNLTPPNRARGPVHDAVTVMGDCHLGDRIIEILNGENPRPYSVLHADESLQEQLADGARTWHNDGLAFEQGVDRFAELQGQFVIFAQATVNPLLARAFNRISLRHGIPWLLTALDGPFLLVGPTFIPFRTPCYECLETRVLMNLREASSYQAYKGALVDGRVTGNMHLFDSVLEALAASITAFEALNMILTGSSFTVGKMLSVYLPTMEFTFNEVLRVPGCVACGASPERDDREMFFDVRTLTYDHTGAP